jgi:hypothetical protein
MARYLTPQNSCHRLVTLFEIAKMVYRGEPEADGQRLEGRVQTVPLSAERDVDVG